jgi:hypothetical protein
MHSLFTLLVAAFSVLANEPPKYTHIDGNLRNNPLHVQWKVAKKMPPSITDSQARTCFALVCSIDDYLQMNEYLESVNRPQLAVASPLNAAIDILQDREVAANLHLNHDETVTQVGSILAKYDIPFGLLVL